MTKMSGPVQQANATFVNVAAGVGVSVPLWIEQVSQWAQVVLPILGAIWLILQGGYFLYGKRRERLARDTTRKESDGPMV
jgi:hypothetical protein